MSGLFKGKSSTVTQEPLIDEAQKKARQSILNFGGTGKLGDFQAGEAFDTSVFDFGLSPTEQLGGSKLFDLLNAKESQGFQDARGTLTGLLNTDFNPDDPSSGFAGFSRQVARATGDADDVLNREAAVQGSRLGSRIVGEKTDLAERKSDILATELGRLFTNQQNRALNAAGTLGNLEVASQQNQRANIAQAFDLGARQRDLQNLKAQTDLNEFVRQRNEKLKQVDTLNTLAQSNVPFGVKSVTTKTASPFSKLLNVVATGAATALGGPLGGAIAGGITGLFSGGGSGVGSGSLSSNGANASGSILGKVGF